MASDLHPDLRAVSRQFQLAGEFVGAEALGTGHINDTYRITCDDRAQYTLQRINHQVFKDPVAMMENIERVTAHVRGKLRDRPDWARRTLTVIPARDGRPFHRDERGNYWRVFRFIENARTFDTAESPLQAFEAARAFGRLQQMLTDLPAPRLHETIPDFHHTPKRYAVLEAAIRADVAGRAKLALPEIDFVLRRKAITGTLLEAGLPERITHNDTKFNNVLFDEATGVGLCVIDLDTVIPGLAPFDFGDQVRTTTSPAAEDERDLSKVTMRFPMFEALVRGYLAGAGEFLTKTEKQSLPVAGKVITFETGIRFLTDFLQGDIYFKVHRDRHNLDRCRTQFRLVESIEAQEGRMAKLVETA